jgi:hypothetical protein
MSPPESDRGAQIHALAPGNVAVPLGFDAALASGPTRELPLERIIDPLRFTHVPEQVHTYREAMRRGDRFPPIAVVRLAGRLWVADGHKRLAAYRGLGVPTIVVEVWSRRRWLQDQGRQLRGKLRQQLAILRRSPFDPAARKAGVRLFWDTIGHWRRLLRSLIGGLR